MSGSHIEVIPRIIDPQIAPVYISSKESIVNEPIVQEIEVKPPTVPTPQVRVVPTPSITNKFFSTLYDWMIPIVFVIAVAIVIYVMWKYWTTRPEPTTNVVVVGSAPQGIKPEDEPKRIISSEDLSKYINDDTSDEESEADDDDHNDDPDDEDDPKEDEEDGETIDPEEDVSEDEEPTESDQEFVVDDNESDDHDHESDQEFIDDSNDTDKESQFINIDEINKLIHEPIVEEPLSRFEVIEDDPLNEDLFDNDDNDVPMLETEQGDEVIEPPRPVVVKRRGRPKKSVIADM